MNQFKLDWYLATQVVNNYALNKVVAAHESSQQDLMRNHTVESVIEHGTRAVMTWAIPTIMKHMAQNQIKGTLGIMGRVGGRVGLRAVPVIGTVMMVKDAYDLYDYLTDA